MAINQEWTKANEEKLLTVLATNPGISESSLASDANIFEPNLSWLLNRLVKAGKVCVSGYSPVYRWNGKTSTQAHYSLL